MTGLFVFPPGLLLPALAVFESFVSIAEEALFLPHDITYQRYQRKKAILLDREAADLL